MDLVLDEIFLSLFPSVFLFKRKKKRGRAWKRGAGWEGGVGGMVVVRCRFDLRKWG